LDPFYTSPLINFISSPRYCWVSPRLVEDKSYNWFVRPTPKFYIPLELADNQDWTTAEWRERLVIGHSVGFDRSFIKEQYYIKVRKLMFTPVVRKLIEIK